jgi:hypothetical protein
VPIKPLRGRRKAQGSKIVYIRDATPEAVRRFSFIVRMRGDGQGDTFNDLMALYELLHNKPKYRSLLERFRLTGEPKYPH